jgi:hypothetical protein
MLLKATPSERFHFIIFKNVMLSKYFKTVNKTTSKIWFYFE